MKSEDAVLKLMVGLAENGTGGMGVTVNVSGMLISGVLVGSKEYIEHYTTMFAGGFPDLSEETQGKLKVIREGLEKLGQRKGEDDDFSFLHLKEASVIYGVGVFPGDGEGTWWRIRRDSVGGFALGSLMPS